MTCIQKIDSSAFVETWIRKPIFGNGDPIMNAPGYSLRDKDNIRHWLSLARWPLALGMTGIMYQNDFIGGGTKVNTAFRTAAALTASRYAFVPVAQRLFSHCFNRYARLRFLKEVRESETSSWDLCLEADFNNTVLRIVDNIVERGDANQYRYYCIASHYNGSIDEDYIEIEKGQQIALDPLHLYEPFQGKRRSRSCNPKTGRWEAELASLKKPITGQEEFICGQRLREMATERMQFSLQKRPLNVPRLD